MASLEDPQPTIFNNFGRLGVQAQNYTVHGDSNVYVNQRTDQDDQDLLQLLPYAAQAAFNTSNKQHTSQCLPDTRVDLLGQIRQWADGNEEKCIFWLNGMAGTGKSTIALTIAREYHEKERLGASFFFSRGSGDLGGASKFVTTIALQLARMSPDLKRYICEALLKDRHIGQLGLSNQWEILILEPLSKLEESAVPLPLVLVIDALDECEGKDDVRLILHLLATAHSLHGVRLRVFVTSRPETPITHNIHALPKTMHQDFILHNISLSTIEHDISIFFINMLETIRQERDLTVGWPGEGKIKLLVEKAGGLFIYAATAYRFIQENSLFAQKRLDLIISHGTASLPPEKKLDKIYTTVLTHSFEGLHDEHESTYVHHLFLHVVGTIVVLFDTISFASLTKLLDLPTPEIKRTLNNLHSVLDVPVDDDGFVRLLHPSFRDFILDKDRCLNAAFMINKNEANRIIFRNCLRVMSKHLRRDICGLRRPGTRVTDVTKRELDKCIPLHVQYACRYWVQHLQQIQIHPSDQVDIYRFFRKYFLFWLEALALMGCMSEGINMAKMLDVMFPTQSKVESNLLSKLRANAKSTFLRKFVSKDIMPERIKHNTDESPALNAFIQDAKRFVLSNGSMVEEWPLQLYCGALMFSPTASIVRDTFWNQIPDWIKIGSSVQRDWSPYLQTLVGHSSQVTAVAFSPDGKLLASGSDDYTVRLWDATTGAARGTLKGHSSWVMAVAFSPDGKLLASGSIDDTVRLWEATTGAARGTLKGHSKSVTAVAFSPDGKLLASGSEDYTVRLWEATTGAARGTLKGHSNSVTAVAFSPDGKLLASGSHDATVRLWDATTGPARGTLKGHSKSVTAVAFSPDGKLLASGSWDDTVRLWDATTGAASDTLKGHSGWVVAVAFSPDGKLLASGSWDDTVRLWDATTGAARGTLKGHSKSVTAVALSPDSKLVASGSGDHTVRLWDATTGAARGTLQVDTEIRNLSFSSCGRYLRTDGGVLDIGSPFSDTGSLTSASSGAYYVSHNWIREGMENIIRLPPDYRPCWVTVWNDKLVLGYSSSRALCIEFKSGKKVL